MDFHNLPPLSRILFFPLNNLSPPPLGVILGFNAGRPALSCQMAAGFNLPQDTTRLHHSLKAAQQRFL